MSKQSEWYLKDGKGVLGPLSENAMRQQVVDSTDPDLQVRQGTTGWHPAEKVREKIKALSTHGIFIKLHGTAEGPFTLTRAFELLQTVSSDGIAIKTGVNGQWIEASVWLAKVRELQRVQEQTARSLAEAIKNPKLKQKHVATATMNRAIEEAILVRESAIEPIRKRDDRHVTIVQATAADEDEILDAIVVEAASVEPATVEAAIIVEIEPEPIILAKLVEEPAPSTDTYAYASMVPNHEAYAPRHNRVVNQSHTHARHFNNPATAQTPKKNWLTSIVGGMLSVVLVIGALGLKANSRFQRRQIGDRTEDSSQSGGVWQSSRSIQTNQPQMVPPRSPTATARMGRHRQREPNVDREGRLFRPTFHTSDGSVQAGTAFAARIDGKDRVLIVTALHLFGPAGGLENQIPSSELASRWQSLSLSDFNDTRDRDRNETVQPLRLARAKPLPETSDHGDVAVCLLDETPSSYFSPLKFAMKAPEANEFVWLVMSGSSEMRHMQAMVHGIDDGWLVYEMGVAAPDLTATSGAPIVNSDGEVVAVHAGSSVQDGRTYGLGTPVDHFLAEIQNQY